MTLYPFRHPYKKGGPYMSPSLFTPESRARNIILASVPHCGSTVIAHCIELMGEHHHGSPSDDPHGYRRAEFTAANEALYKLMYKQDDGREIENVLTSIMPPFVMKNVQLSVCLEAAIPAIVRSGTEPLLVHIDRSVDEVKHSFELRSQWLDPSTRKDPGIWGRTVEELFESMRSGLMAWRDAGLPLENLPYEAFRAAKALDSRDAFRELFTFVGDIDDAGFEQAYQCFDAKRSLRGNKKKGHSSWE